MRRSTLLVLISLPTALCAYTDDAAWTQIPMGSRAAAMGGAGVANAQGSAGAWINPAALLGDSRFDAVATHASWLADTNMDWLSVGGRLGRRHALALYGAFLGNEDTRRDETGLETGTFQNQASLWGGAWAVGWAGASMGFSVKQVTQSWAGANQSQWGGDFGSQFQLLPRYWRVGFAMQNIGTGFNDTGGRLPLTARYGTAFTNLPGGFELDIDQKLLTNSDGNTVILGLEWCSHAGPVNMALRAGWDNELEKIASARAQRWSLGGSMDYQGWQIEGVWQPMGDLGSPWRLSLGWAFGDSSNDPPQRKARSSVGTPHPLP